MTQTGTFLRPSKIDVLMACPINVHKYTTGIIRTSAPNGIHKLLFDLPQVPEISASLTLLFQSNQPAHFHILFFIRSPFPNFAEAPNVGFSLIPDWVT